LGWRLACDGFSGLSRATIPWQKGKGDDSTVCGEENNAPGNAASFICWNLSTKNFQNQHESRPEQILFLILENDMMANYSFSNSP
jgi:hypothetical protein